ncbi:MAG: DUF6624 domain-containing protein [Candidatus Magasanikbacteria bacterium]
MKYPKISKKLEKMRDRDQDLRKQVDPSRPNKDEELKNKIEKIDREHTEKLKDIIEEIGWPTIPKVGGRASEGAWILAQHSRDLDFQRKCLEMLKENKEDIYESKIPYLKDRIMVNEEDRQIYGTQFRRTEDGLEPYPIKNKENLNERRKKFGLESFEEYKKKATPPFKWSKCILINDNDVLLVRQKPAEDKWTLPGGRVKFHESFEETVKREIKEELGLELEEAEKLEKWHTDHRDFEDVFCFFKAEINKSEVSINDDEILRFEWFLFKELPGNIGRVAQKGLKYL